MTIPQYIIDAYTCEYCGGTPGQSDCKCHPLEIILYSEEGNAIQWTGPIGCMTPENRVDND